MTRPPTRLFHLHYNASPVSRLERGLTAAGLPLYQRFGWVDEESTSPPPTDFVPDEWQLYAETLQRGDANLMLGTGSQFRFDHIGIYATEFDAIMDRAEAAGRGVRDRDGRRPFLMTPWGFRIEIHPDDVERDLGSWSTVHFDEIVLLVPDARSVRRNIAKTLGPVPGLVMMNGDVERPAVPQFTLGGDHFPNQQAVDFHVLADHQAVCKEEIDEPR